MAASANVGMEQTAQRAWTALADLAWEYVAALKDRDDVGAAYAEWQYFAERLTAASLYPWEYTALLDGPDDKHWGVTARH